MECDLSSGNSRAKPVQIESGLYGAGDESETILSYLDKVNRCNRWQPSRFAPLTVAGTQVGWLTAERVAVLARHAKVFVPAHGGIALHPSLKTPRARTQAVRDIAPALMFGA